MTHSALILGFGTTSLSAAERQFFKQVRPWGYILFARNIDNPAQVLSLTDELRSLDGRESLPILVDQEGGRVARFRAPFWRHPPAAARFAGLHTRSASDAIEAARLNSQIIADDLRAVGVTVDCAPCIDVPFPGAHDVIGDRAYGRDPAGIAALGRAVCEGLQAGGVAPIIKHIPGHGRAMSDSHLDLPIVDASLADLRVSDFLPFRALADAPMAMTAHVVYAGIDPAKPATLSARIIGDVIRGEIGFGGLLMTDDLSMRALQGSFAARTQSSYAAGCDVVLHCNGNMAEMAEIAVEARPLLGDSLRRAEAAEAAIPVRPLAFDRGAALQRLTELLPDGAVA
ncbi:MAG: beta-N-acetylhexosaminidase [Alphaproteobacteria bacterium]|nr:beta-N-acetylhexosaminidase [Alphaproteobacteria bacterium]